MNTTVVALSTLQFATLVIVEKPSVEALVVAVPVTLLLDLVALAVIVYVVAGDNPEIVVLADVPLVVENDV